MRVRNIISLIAFCVVLGCVSLAFGGGTLNLLSTTNAGAQKATNTYGCVNGSLQISGASTSGIALGLEGSNGTKCDTAPTKCTWVTLASYSAKGIVSMPTPPVQFVRVQMTSTGVVATATPYATETPKNSVTPATVTPYPTTTPGLAVSFYCP